MPPINQDMVFTISNPEGSCSPPFALYAFLFTWNEADIIEATVSNARRQGCERVFLVDHNSDDDTVPLALAAGAELLDVHRERYFHENDKVTLSNKFARAISAECARDDVWWLFLDADEFPHGPKGLTVREFLEQLDERFRVVGSIYLDHYPNRNRYAPGMNPVAVFPHAERSPYEYCSAGHLKHQLLKFTRQDASLFVGPGYHSFGSTACPLPEPEASLIVHHFPHRNIEVTSKRLKRIIEEGRLRQMLTLWKTQRQRMEASSAFNDVPRDDDAIHHWHARYENLRSTYRKYQTLPEWTALLPPEDAYMAGWPPPDIPDIS